MKGLSLTQSRRVLSPMCAPTGLDRIDLQLSPDSRTNIHFTTVRNLPHKDFSATLNDPNSLVTEYQPLLSQTALYSKG